MTHFTTLTKRSIYLCENANLISFFLYFVWDSEKSETYNIIKQIVFDEMKRILKHVLIWDVKLQKPMIKYKVWYIDA